MLGRVATPPDPRDDPSRAPQLQWAGRDRRRLEELPSLPLFDQQVHDAHATLTDMLGEPPQRLAEPFRHPDEWSNRLICGDALAAMLALRDHERLAGQVQCIFMDPPYGVRFGSNFQPFLDKRTVRHDDDRDLPRELETVQAYRDTWQLGVHSYLSYLRDRLELARELLSPSGSLFVQIGEENLHHVRELLDELFGPEHFVSLISFRKTSAQTSALLPSVNDYLLWYARDRSQIKYRQLYVPRAERTQGGTFDWIETPDGRCQRLSAAQRRGEESVPEGRRFRAADLTSQSGGETTRFEVEFEGKHYLPSTTRGWSTNQQGMERLRSAGRLFALRSVLCFKRYEEDFPFVPLSNAWDDTTIGTFTKKRYVVQTAERVVARCLWMTTDPGDLVLDPTCGSGTTPVVAERLGRRWVGIDVGRVPLALTLQRLLTTGFPCYALQDAELGPAGGFVYEAQRARNGRPKGGRVPRVTLRSLARGEATTVETLVDRPAMASDRVRPVGPFRCQSVAAPALGRAAADSEEPLDAFTERVLALLQRSPRIALPGGAPLSLSEVRASARTLVLAGEAQVDGQRAAILLGPQGGPLGCELVDAALDEAKSLGYPALYALGFAIEPAARAALNDATASHGVAAIYVQMTPDLALSGLLKTTRASQLFSVCGQPELKLSHLADGRYHVELLGVDVFDPVTMSSTRTPSEQIPAWLLDPDYDGRCLRPRQVFFPRTKGLSALARALGLEPEQRAGLGSSTDASFQAGPHRRMAVLVIDRRGNELLATQPLAEP